MCVSASLPTFACVGHYSSVSIGPSILNRSVTSAVLLAMYVPACWHLGLPAHKNLTWSALKRTYRLQWPQVLHELVETMCPGFCFLDFCDTLWWPWTPPTSNRTTSSSWALSLLSLYALGEPDQDVNDEPNTSDSVGTGIALLLLNKPYSCLVLWDCIVSPRELTEPWT